MAAIDAIAFLVEAIRLLNRPAVQFHSIPITHNSATLQKHTQNSHTNNSLHAYRCSNGVAHRNSEQIYVLNRPAHLHLETTWKEGKRKSRFLFIHSLQRKKILEPTEVGLNGVHVGVVALAVVGVAGPVTRGQKDGGVIRDESEQQHHGGAGHPPQLPHRPRQRQYSRPNHRCNNMSTRRPHRPCKSQNYQTVHNQNQFQRERERGEEREAHQFSWGGRRRRSI